MPLRHDARLVRGALQPPDEQPFTARLAGAGSRQRELQALLRAARPGISAAVRWAPDATWGLLDHVRMEEELERLLGRRVDVLSRRAVESSANWVIRRAILDSAEPIYAA